MMREGSVGRERRAEVIRGTDEVVAEDHGGLVSALAVDGVAAAACVGVVEHVVVDERRHVDHLDDGCDGDQLIRGWLIDGGAGCGARQQDQRGAEHLAAEAFDVLAERLHRGDLGGDRVVDAISGGFEAGEHPGLERGEFGWNVEDAFHSGRSLASTALSAFFWATM
jgi:hypothetical protein